MGILISGSVVSFHVVAVYRLYNLALQDRYFNGDVDCRIEIVSWRQIQIFSPSKTSWCEKQQEDVLIPKSDDEMIWVERFNLIDFLKTSAGMYCKTNGGTDGCIER